MSTRRRTLGALSGMFFVGCSGVPVRREAPTAADPRVPIVFVHGRGDGPVAWTSMLWRFESNDWPREWLFAPDMPYAAARPEGRTMEEARAQADALSRALAMEVDRAIAVGGLGRVVLVGHATSAGPIAAYLAAGGAARVSHVVLGGASPSMDPGQVPRRLMLHPQSEGPKAGAIAGANDLALPGADAREAAYGPQAFEAAWRFITGREPFTSAIEPEASVSLNGRVFAPSTDRLAGNKPLPGAKVEVYATDAKTGACLSSQPLHQRVVGADGVWGPFTGRPGATYEFVINAPGCAATHVYRSPFPRSTAFVNLRAELQSEADRSAKATVTLRRSCGYFAVPRDRIVLDGRGPSTLAPGVTGVSSLKVRVDDTAYRSVQCEFNGERIVGRAWGAAAGHTVVLELSS